METKQENIIRRVKTNHPHFYLLLKWVVALSSVIGFWGFYQQASLMYHNQSSENVSLNTYLLWSATNVLFIYHTYIERSWFVLGSSGINLVGCLMVVCLCLIY